MACEPSWSSSHGPLCGKRGMHHTVGTDFQASWLQDRPQAESQSARAPVPAWPGVPSALSWQPKLGTQTRKSGDQGSELSPSPRPAASSCDGSFVGLPAPSLWDVTGTYAPGIAVGSSNRGGVRCE